MEKVRKCVIKSTYNDIFGQTRVSNLQMAAVSGQKDHCNSPWVPVAFVTYFSIPEDPL